MPWSAEVPFPAEDISRCRGRDAKIGWIHGEDEKAHPVEIKGWHGVPCAEGTPGSVRGRTLDGEYVAVREPRPPRAGLFGDEPDKELRAVVFQSHFVACPKRDRFYR